MLFEIHAEKSANDKAIFYYDNMTNVLKDSNGNIYEWPTRPDYSDHVEYKSFDKDHPLVKSKLITHLKIQLGLSCNYSCDYCSQKFVERAPETSKKDIDAFLEKMDQPPTNNINAGCYVFAPKVIETIPRGKVVSVERETFPNLISSGELVLGFIDQAYWLDIGTPAALMKGSIDLVKGFAATDALDRYKFAHRDHEYVAAANAEVQGAVTGGSAIGANCKIAKGASVDASIICDDVIIGAASVKNSFIAKGAKKIGRAHV